MSFQVQSLQIATTDPISPYNVRQAIIGGFNTTLNSDDTQLIGPSSLNVTLNPLAGKLFLKDNPVTIKENSVKAAVGTITALDVSRGVIELQVAGVYTLDTTVNIRNRVYDASGTAFVGSPRPMFEVTFHNTSGGNVTINSGVGQTLTNGASISIASGNSTTVKFWLTSATTMNVESVEAGTTTTLTSAGGTTLVNNGVGPALAVKGLTAGPGVSLTNGVTDITITNSSPASSVTLSNAGGTVSLVNDGAGPALANKGLTAGTGILLVDGGTQVTISNSSPATSVTLSNAVAPAVGEAGLIVDGTGPTLSIKKLVAGANVILTNNVNDVTIAAAGGGGITEPLFTSNNRAIVSGRNNNFVNVNAASYGAVVGGISNILTFPIPSGPTQGGNATIGGDGVTVNFNVTSRGNVVVGSSAGTTSIAGDGHVVVGGMNNTNTQGIAGGSVFIGGYGITRTINSYAMGSVNIAATGLITTSSKGSVLIGGTNTTVGTTDGIVCVGASILTTTLNPSIRKTYIKDSPIYIKENAPKAVVGTILAADITKGVVELQAAGAYTLDTTVNIRNTLLDSTGAAFVGNIRPSFEVTFYNSSGGVTTIAIAAGQTLTNGVSPISIAAGESRTWKFWFTSATTMLIEDLLSSSAAGGGAVTTLSNAAVPGVGEAGLVVDGTGPTLSIKKIIPGANITLTNNANNVTIAAAGGALSEPLFTSNKRAIVSGRGNTITNINANSYGALLGGQGNNPTIGLNSGNVIIGGKGMSPTMNTVDSGCVCIGGELGSLALSTSACCSIGSSSASGTLNGHGSCLVGSLGMTGTVSAYGSVLVGSTAFGGNINGNGAVVIGSYNLSGNINGEGCCVIGGDAPNVSFPAGGLGNVTVGGTGPITFGFGAASDGSVMAAGWGGSKISIAKGCFSAGGTNCTVAFNSGSGGAVALAGNALTTTFNTSTYGAIAIAAGGTFDGSISGVLIGGTNTTMGGGVGTVCIGSTTLTTTLRPTARKTFIKDSPVFIKENTTRAAGVITATEVSRGIIQLTAGAAFTLDTTVNIRNALLDSTGTAFVGNIRPSFDLIIYNSSGAGATVAAGAGQTFINVASPAAIPAGQSRRWTLWFTSATTILVHN